jgi:predicted nucleotidyltransferase/uncharacterized protein (UPF0332 family)
MKKMVKKTAKKTIRGKSQKPSKTNAKIRKKDIPTLQLKSERDIAMDFAQKVYQRFNEMVKSVILFGSQAKGKNITCSSDIDIIILIDDVSISFEEKMVAWYREELGKVIALNPYKKDLHVNTLRLSTWWRDLLRGDPVVLSIIRSGDPLIDFGGFFDPLKRLMLKGEIKPTPEAVYTVLNRIPSHIIKSRIAEMSAIEGVYWAMVESAQALLMSISVLPPSPEHIALLLKEHFVNKKLLPMKYVTYYRDLFDLHRKIIHGEIKNLDGKIIDGWQDIAEDFFRVVMDLIDKGLK